MSDEFYGFSENPASLIEAGFSQVAEESMRGLPFYNSAISVKTCGFQIFDNQWIGTVLTPWMLNVIILPGPDQIWDKRQIGSRVGLELPYGNMTFVVGQMEKLGQYLACSLLSPLDKHLTAEQGVKLAEDSMRMLLSLPVRDVNAPTNLGRRSLFSVKK